MPTIRDVTANQQLEFLKLASTKGVDAAVISKGRIVSAEEAAALRQLSDDEITALYKVNKKLADIRKAGGLDAADWTCVNTVC